MIFEMYLYNSPFVANHACPGRKELRLKKVLLSLLLSACVVAGTYAQQESQTPRPWDLRECIDFALANNLTIARGQNSVASAEVDFSQSRYNSLPTINAGVGYGWNWGRSVNPVTYQYTNQELNSINPFVSGSLPLFTGLRNHYTIRQNQHALMASEQELLKTKNDVMVNITSLYLTVIFNKEQVSNAQYQVESSRVQLERIRKQVSAGALARSEELNLDAQLATNETNLIQRENALNLSLLQLKQALQIPASQPFDIVQMDIDVEDLVIENTRDEVYEVARQSMPELKGAALRVESSDYAVKAARGSYYPRLTLNGSVNSNYSSASAERHFFADGGSPIPIPDTVGVVSTTGDYVVRTVEVPSGSVGEWGRRQQLRDNVYRSLSFNLTIPIFNGMQTRSAVQRTKIQNQNAIIAQKEAQNTLRQNVENAYNDALAASKTYNAALRLVTAREEAFRMMTQRYSSGAANSFEYQVSQNDYFQAQTELTRAKYDFIFRKKLLDFYLGKPLGY